MKLWMGLSFTSLIFFAPISTSAEEVLGVAFLHTTFTPTMFLIPKGQRMGVPLRPNMCLSVSVCVCVAETQGVSERERDRERVCPRPCITQGFVIQTMFLSIPISTVQTSAGMFSGGNALQTRSMLL